MTMSGPSFRQLVYFDLETTSLKYDAEITQIAAQCGSRCFNQYVLPEGDIEDNVSRITGIEKQYDELYVDGEEVETMCIYGAMNSFIDWLNRFKFYGVLIGHNIHAFDMKRLLFNTAECGLVEELKDAIDGYVDTLPLFQDAYPDLGKYGQAALLDRFGVTNHNPHNALDDTRALRRLMTRTQLFRDRELLQKHRRYLSN